MISGRPASRPAWLPGLACLRSAQKKTPSQLYDAGFSFACKARGQDAGRQAAALAAQASSRQLSRKHSVMQCMHACMHAAAAVAVLSAWTGNLIRDYINAYFGIFQCEKMAIGARMHRDLTVVFCCLFPELLQAVCIAGTAGQLVCCSPGYRGFEAGAMALAAGHCK